MFWLTRLQAGHLCYVFRHGTFVKWFSNKVCWWEKSVWEITCLIGLSVLTWAPAPVSSSLYWSLPWDRYPHPNVKPVTCGQTFRGYGDSQYCILQKWHWVNGTKQLCDLKNQWVKWKYILWNTLGRWQNFLKMFAVYHGLLLKEDHHWRAVLPPASLSSCLPIMPCFTKHFPNLCCSWHQSFNFGPVGWGCGETRGINKDIGLKKKTSRTNAKNTNANLGAFSAYNLQWTLTVDNNNPAISLQVLCLGLKTTPSSVPFYRSDQDKIQDESILNIWRKKHEERFIYLILLLTFVLRHFIAVKRKHTLESDKTD